MNIYDEAYALAKALKESDEQKRLVEAEKALKKVQKIHLRTPQNIILKAEITEYKE